MEGNPPEDPNAVIVPRPIRAPEGVDLSDLHKPPLDDVDDIKWLDEEDPRRKEIEAWNTSRAEHPPENPEVA